MEFKIKFQAQANELPTPFSIEIYDRLIGIIDVDFIRKEICPNLSIYRIIGFMDGTKGNPECEIEESLARESGLFDHSSELVIKTPLYWLNQFAQLEVEQIIVPETGEILRAKLRPQVNFDAVLQDWADRGFPRQIEAPEDYEVEFYLHPTVE